MKAAPVMSDDVRPCEYIGCRKPLVRKPYENNQQWEKRRYCDKVCCGLQKGVRGRTSRAEMAAKQPKKRKVKAVKWRAPVTGPTVVTETLAVNEELLRARMYRGALH
jgi:hypothetical protein